jgi:hypothetical protein
MPPPPPPPPPGPAGPPAGSSADGTEMKPDDSYAAVRPYQSKELCEKLGLCTDGSHAERLERLRARCGSQGPATVAAEVEAATAAAAKAAVHQRRQHILANPPPMSEHSVERSELRFFAIGDWGAPSDVANEVKGARDVAAAMARWAREHYGGSPDFILGLGDNFYENGAQSVNDSCFDTQWVDVFLRPHVELRVPWWHILGNHDYNGSPEAQVQYHHSAATEANAKAGPREDVADGFSPRQLWQMPNRNYSFAYTLGNATDTSSSSTCGTRVEFHGLDTNGCQASVRTKHPEQKEELHAQVDSLRQRLQQRPAQAAPQQSMAQPPPWRIVFGHHPLHTGGKRHSKTAECLREPSYSYQGETCPGYDLGGALAQGSVGRFHPISCSRVHRAALNGQLRFCCQTGPCPR